MLIYNLVHSKLESKELVTTSNMGIARLHALLDSWKDALSKGIAPQALFYLLEHQYIDHLFRFESLNGHDHEIATHLRQVCEELGIAVFLAAIRRTAEGICDEGDGRGYNHHGAYHEIVETCTMRTCLEHIIDLAGTEVAQDLFFDDYNFIQDDPFAMLEPDEEDYRGRTTTHIYHRTVRILTHSLGTPMNTN